MWLVVKMLIFLMSLYYFHWIFISTCSSIYLFNYFFYFWLCCSLLLCRLSWVAASGGYPLVVECGLFVVWLLILWLIDLEHRLSSPCDTGTSLLQDMWNLPRLRIKPMYTEFEGRFSNTEPPGKSQGNKICHCFYRFSIYLPWSDATRCHNLSFLNA